ncbi:MAG: hypothetical protein AABW79_03695 [Nanoarchaeota archaeon]
MKNRGLFFTMAAIMLLTLFFISYTFYSVIKDQSQIKERIQTLDSFVKGAEEDLARQAYIAGFRTFVVYQTKIAETGNYIPNITSSSEELFFNGTLYGNPESLMIGVTLPELNTALQEKANKINANFMISNYSLSIYQEDPWNVVFEINTNILVEDQGGLALWNKTEKIISKVPISGFEDPIYTINTQSQVLNKIRQTPYSIFIIESDVSNLNAHLTNSYYLANPLSPSYLNRLQGNFSADPNGIESIVNLQKLSSAGIVISQKSGIDYIYFSPQTPTAHRITGTPSWFYLDDAHLDTYQASALAQ